MNVIIRDSVTLYIIYEGYVSVKYASILAKDPDFILEAPELVLSA